MDKLKDNEQCTFNDSEILALKKLKQYLSIQTVHPDPDYEPAVDFLRNYSQELGLSFTRYEYVKGKPIVLLTLEGRDSSRKSILLNSHMDVVPVEKSQWKFPPFEAKTSDGVIYARGIQDMKSVGIQYLEAIRRIQTVNTTRRPLFPKNVHICFVPDEEIGSKDGMEKFVETDEFEKLNIGFGLDEGLASENGHYKCYFAERLIKWLTVTVVGNPGHGSKFIDDTAVLKLLDLMNKMASFREKQQNRQIDENLTIGQVSSLNMTQIHGGFQTNVIPSEFKLNVDIHVTPKEDQEIEKMLNKWNNLKGISIDTYRSGTVKPTNWKDCVEWNKISTLFKNLGMEYDQEIFTGATDARFLRIKNIPVMGFSPMINTPIQLHDHNESLSTKMFLKGVEIYEGIIRTISDD